jgi:hypothetical protein
MKPGLQVHFAAHIENQRGANEENGFDKLVPVPE